MSISAQSAGFLSGGTPYPDFSLLNDLDHDEGLQPLIPKHNLSISQAGALSYLLHAESLTSPLTSPVSRKHRKKVPAPRLVGIETNPGPVAGRTRSRIKRDLVDLISQTGVSLGTAAARAAMKKKKKKPAPANSFPSSNSTVRRLAMPANRSVSVTNSVSSSHTISVPFDCTSLPVQTDASGLVNFGGSALRTLDLDPNHSVAGYYLFGAAGTVANCFTRWRLRSLELEYLPCVQTTIAGGLAFVTIADSAVPTTTTLDASQIGITDGSIVTPLWNHAAIPCNFNKEWLYVADPGTVSTANERQTGAGRLYLASVTNTSLGINNALVGLIRARGVMEFQQFRSQYNPAALSRPRLSPPDNSASSSSSNTKTAEDEVEYGLDHSVYIPSSAVGPLRAALGALSM